MTEKHKQQTQTCSVYKQISFYSSPKLPVILPA